MKKTGFFKNVLNLVTASITLFSCVVSFLLDFARTLVQASNKESLAIKPLSICITVFLSIAALALLIHLISFIVYLIKRVKVMKEEKKLIAKEQGEKPLGRFTISEKISKESAKKIAKRARFSTRVYYLSLLTLVLAYAPYSIAKFIFDRNYVFYFFIAALVLVIILNAYEFITATKIIMLGREADIQNKVVWTIYQNRLVKENIREDGKVEKEIVRFADLTDAYEIDNDFLFVTDLPYVENYVISKEDGLSIESIQILKKEIDRFNTK